MWNKGLETPISPTHPQNNLPKSIAENSLEPVAVGNFPLKNDLQFQHQ